MQRSAIVIMRESSMGRRVSANGDNDCVKPCDGNAQENCGAASKLEVYQVVTAGSRVARGAK